MEVPVAQITEKLHQLGWQFSTTVREGAVIVAATGPDGNLTGTAETEAAALIALHRRVTGTSRCVDPNRERPRQSIRVARLGDDRTTFPQRVHQYLSMHDAWWTKDRKAQTNKIEDALRMTGAVLDIEATRRVAEHDIETGGSGHAFRAYATDNGIGPRTSSNAWLLLAPLSSELAMHDPVVSHTMRITEATNHWAYERGLQALRHELGHDHIPLGLYSGAVTSELQAHPRSLEHVAAHTSAIATAVRTFQRDTSLIVAQYASSLGQFVEVHEAKLETGQKEKLRAKLKSYQHAPRKIGKWAALHTKATEKEFEEFLEHETKDDPSPYSSSFRRDAIKAFKDFKDIPDIFRSGMGIIGD